METQASDLKWRPRRIEKTVPYLFRLCAILAAFQVVLDCAGRAQLEANGCILTSPGGPKN